MNKRITTHAAVLTNAHTNPPQVGEQVLALTIGGKLVETTWKSDSLRYFDAWCGYPTVPDDVKALQSARYSCSITVQKPTGTFEEVQTSRESLVRKSGVDWRFPR
jgi:hypothetical protein